MPEKMSPLTPALSLLHDAIHLMAVLTKKDASVSNYSDKFHGRLVTPLT